MSNGGKLKRFVIKLFTERKDSPMNILPKFYCPECGKHGYHFYLWLLPVFFLITIVWLVNSK